MTQHPGPLELNERPSRILVVDDDAKNLRMMEAMLLPLGNDLLTAGSGGDALALMAREPVDLVLLDVMMPEPDGFSVLAALKRGERSRAIPVIMVTALSDSESRIRALELGADDFLSKPVDQSELRARVRSSLKTKTYHDALVRYQRRLEDLVEERTRQLQTALQELKSSSLETIYRLTRASEVKDEGTGAHIQRMSLYAAAIARSMEMPEDFVEALLYAAPMHDIGKIGIPDRILLKEGSLSEEEWEIMRRHTHIGARILHGSHSKFLQLAAAIAHSHHERWDGSGYPDGLEGEKIPIAARIAAVADVFDALTTERPYRSTTFTVAEAFEAIARGAGTHFDPQVVEAFLRVREEIVRIHIDLSRVGESGLLQCIRVRES
ncbi:MAG: response regulator [Myxococcota bacterium]|jgi:putative two-component system response regulator|nr:response regulator [Myxococcota bacterium]